jgi:tRNA-2-methylthio-N6-dimethylallyladenosine synthase
MKYYFWTLGCAMNISDAERISAVFDSYGFSRTEEEKEADIFCIIACSIRQHAVDRIFGKINQLKNNKVTTILTGCVLDQDRRKLEKEFNLVFDINEIEHLTSFISKKYDIKKTYNIDDYLSLTPSYLSKFRAYVPISTGCDNFCSYCAVPYTRGREKSREVTEIVKEVRGLVKAGFKEIILLGQNVNSYGQDIRGKKDISGFIELVKEIDGITGKYRVYFFSNHPKDMSDELIETLALLKHFPHYVHLPLQAGSDDVIKRMNRHYTKKQYLELVEKIKKSMPDVAITTDIIVGFPGETETDFQDTLDVAEKVVFDMVYLAQYSPRPGTKAAKMADDVSKLEKKRREELLNQVIAKKLEEKNKSYVGRNLTVLIDGTKNDKYYGRTEGYKVVEIKKSPKIALGDFVNVKINDSSAWKLFAE